MADAIAVRTAVYRLYDAADCLLYVGKSNNPDRRCEVHKTKDWWRRVARRTDEWFDDPDLAGAAEVAAIETERPACNWIHATYNQPGHTPTRPIRIPPDLWAAFGRAVKKLGTTRSAYLRETMRWVIHDSDGAKPRMPRRPAEPTAREQSTSEGDD